MFEELVPKGWGLLGELGSGLLVSGLQKLAQGECPTSNRDFAVALARRQFRMIDAAHASFAQVGPAEISVKTWTVDEYEIECLERLRIDGRIIAGLLVIDHGARQKNAGLIKQ